MDSFQEGLAVVYGSPVQIEDIIPLCMLIPSLHLKHHTFVVGGGELICALRTHQIFAPSKCTKPALNKSVTRQSKYITE